jgi:MinD-like ATPase involved in chromosome partitioning or flagellar assembly
VIRVGGDSGQPVVIAEPESASAVAIREIAAKVAAAVSVQNIQNPPQAEFKADPDLPVMQ